METLIGCGGGGELTDEGRSLEPGSFLGERATAVVAATCKRWVRGFFPTTDDEASVTEEVLLSSIRTARSVGF